MDFFFFSCAHTSTGSADTGDFNFPYETFQPLIGAGYRDAGPAGAGVHTCCFCCDQDDRQNGGVLSSNRKLVGKIDLILMQGAVTATNTHLVGAPQIFRPNLAPGVHLASDHAGVFATLHITPSYQIKRTIPPSKAPTPNDPAPPRAHIGPLEFPGRPNR